MPGKEAEKERFVDRLMALSKRFPRMGFYFRSLIDNAPLSTIPIEAVFRQDMGFFTSLGYALFSVALVLESVSSCWLKNPARL